MHVLNMHATSTHSRCAQNATTRPRTVHSLAELRMALEDKARGQRIAQMRKRRRMTQQAMAEALDVSYRAYQTWEAGTMPEWSNVEKLAKFFRVKPEAIIGETEPAPEEAPQLDRIEAKLDRILDTLAVVSELVDAAEVRALGDSARKIADAPVPTAPAKPGRRRAAKSRTPPAPTSR